MSDDDGVEPSAVNMEIASTGKVTARKEDGTRVATPLQPGTPVTATARPTSSIQATSAQAMPASLAMSGRPFSYAAALASVPQDLAHSIQHGRQAHPQGDNNIPRSLSQSRSAARSLFEEYIGRVFMQSRLSVSKDLTQHLQGANPQLTVPKSILPVACRLHLTSTQRPLPFCCF